MTIHKIASGYIAPTAKYITNLSRLMIVVNTRARHFFPIRLKTVSATTTLAALLQKLFGVILCRYSVLCWKVILSHANARAFTARIMQAAFLLPILVKFRRTLPSIAGATLVFTVTVCGLL